MDCTYKIGLNHPQPSLFRVSQWECGATRGQVSLWYLIWRVVLAVFMGINFIILWWMSDSKFFIYLTNQGLLLLVLHYSLDCLLTMILYIDQMYVVGPRAAGRKMSPAYKTSWFLANSASSLAVMITLFFWSFLYQYEEKNSYWNTLAHLLNTISVMADLAITGRPTRWQHWFHPVLVGLVYLIFSITYWALGGTDPDGNHWIYPMVDWDKPWIAAGAAGGFAVGLALTHIVIHVLSWARLWIYGGCQCGHTQDTQHIEDEEILPLKYAVSDITGKTT